MGTYIVHYNFGEAIQNCTENKVVLGESTSRLNYFMRSKFTVNGETSVHIMRESLFQFSVSYVMQKDSPYTSRFSEKLDQLKQSGLIDHWMNNEFEKIARLQD